MTYERLDKRALDPDQRIPRSHPNISPYAEGSALIEVGRTKGHLYCERRRKGASVLEK
jgi:ribonuclease PH